MKMNELLLKLDALLAENMKLVAKISENSATIVETVSEMKQSIYQADNSYKELSKRVERLKGVVDGHQVEVIHNILSEFLCEDKVSNILHSGYLAMDNIPELEEVELDDAIERNNLRNLMPKSTTSAESWDDGPFSGEVEVEEELPYSDKSMEQYSELSEVDEVEEEYSVTESIEEEPAITKPIEEKPTITKHTETEVVTNNSYPSTVTGTAKPNSLLSAFKNRKGS